MKLSEKGFEKMFAWSGEPKEITFDQDDFEDVVVLTKQEAELLMDTMLEAQQLEVRPDANGETVAKLDGLVNLIAEKVEKTK